MRRGLAFLTVTLITLLLLSGCLSVEAHISMEDGARGRLTYRYTISRELLDAEVFDVESENWPIPVARRDFELLDHALPEAQLVDYSREDREETSVVTATYSFDSLEALARLLSARDSLELEAGGRGLRIPLSPGGVSELGDGERSFLESYLEGGSITYRIDTPSPIRESSLGDPEGRTLLLEYGFTELLDRSQPLILELIW